jgi:hypothetical protein
MFLQKIYSGILVTIPGRNKVAIIIGNKIRLAGNSKRAKPYAANVHETSVKITLGITIRKEFKK